LALVQLPGSWFGPGDGSESAHFFGTVTCLRSVLMKPEHGAWMGEIWDRLNEASAEVLGK
jgi:tyrosine decarboxylase / aspartate 1-decarboxylase